MDNTKFKNQVIKLNPIKSLDYIAKYLSPFSEAYQYIKNMINQEEEKIQERRLEKAKRLTDVKVVIVSEKSTYKPEWTHKILLRCPSEDYPDDWNTIDYEVIVHKFSYRLFDQSDLSNLLTRGLDSGIKKTLLYIGKLSKTFANQTVYYFPDEDYEIDDGDATEFYNNIIDDVKLVNENYKKLIDDYISEMKLNLSSKGIYVDSSDREEARQEYIDNLKKGIIDLSLFHEAYFNYYTDPNSDRIAQYIYAFNTNGNIKDYFNGKLMQDNVLNGTDPVFTSLFKNLRSCKYIPVKY